MTRHFEVSTWGTRSYELTPREAAELGASKLVRVEVGGEPDVYRLRGLSLVGVAAGSGWELRVSSHLDVSEVMFLLTYARSPTGWRTTTAGFAPVDTLLAAVARGFAVAAEQALRSGPLRGYRRVEEAAPVLRGRLRISDQLARGGLPTPALVVRDEYDLDVAENRILAAASRVLTRLPLVALPIRARLRRILALLDGVAAVSDLRTLRPPPITRLNRHYEAALVLADLVLRGTSIGSRAGTAASVTFAFELHRVFEDFLAVALGEALQRRGARLERQPPGWWLDRERSLGLEPDFVVVRGDRRLAVLDAKFKRLDRDLGGDAYQLLAYLLELGPRRGLLVSAGGTPSKHHVHAADKVLAVWPLGVDQPPARVLSAVDDLAEQIVRCDDAAPGTRRATAAGARAGA